MVQWKWPTSHGEQAFVAMMGGLHVEMALWSVLGDRFIPDGIAFNKNKVCLNSCSYN